jgi:hypothetical protein
MHFSIVQSAKPRDDGQTGKDLAAPLDVDQTTLYRALSA